MVYLLGQLDNFRIDHDDVFSASLGSEHPNRHTELDRTKANTVRRIDVTHELRCELLHLAVNLLDRLRDPPENWVWVLHHFFHAISSLLTDRTLTEG